MTLAAAIASAISGSVPSALKFWAPLTHTAKPLRGTGTYNFTRDSGATVIDHEGKIQVCKTSEIRFTGARREVNLCNHSKNASHATWAKSGAVANGDYLTFSASSQYAYYPLPDLDGGETITVSFDLSGAPGETITAQWISSTTGGLVGQTPILLTADTRRYYASYTFPAGAQTTVRFYLRRETTDTAGTVKFTNIRIQEGSLATEYVSAGVGTGLDYMATKTVSDWNTVAGWTVDSGNSLTASSTTNDQTIDMPTEVIEGKTYVVEFDANLVGGWNFAVGGTFVTSGLVNIGFNSHSVVAGASGQLLFNGIAALTGTITNLSVRLADHGANVDGVKYFNTESTIRTLACWGDSLTNANHDGSLDHPWGTLLMGKYGINNFVRGGVNGDISTVIASRMTGASLQDRSGVTIIWAGRNNFTSSATVQADIAAMVAATNGQYLVLSIVNSDDNPLEYAGGAEYDQIIALNAALESTYGVNYVDIRSHLVSLYDPEIPQDVIDFGNDIPPSSLRFDTLHFNKAGYKAIEEKLIEVLDAKGWLNASVPVPLTTLKNYLAEPQRTNHIVDHNPKTGWAFARLGLDAAQDKKVSGYNLTRVESIDNTVGFTRLSESNVIISSTGDHVISCVVQAGEVDLIGIALYEAAPTSQYSARILFNLTNGTIETAANGTGHIELIDPVNMLYRVWVKGNGAGGSTTFTPYLFLNSLYSTSSIPIGNGLWIDGVQVEEGAFPTSIIPTEGAALERAADALSYPQGLIKDEGGLVSFTMNSNLSSAEYIATGSHQAILSCTGGVTSGLVYTHVSSGRYTSFDGVNAEAVTQNIVAGVDEKIAVRWGGTGLRLAADGTLSPLDLYDGDWGDIGLSIMSGTAVSAHMGDLKIYNKELSDAKLQELTT